MAFVWMRAFANVARYAVIAGESSMPLLSWNCGESILPNLPVYPFFASPPEKDWSGCPVVPGGRGTIQRPMWSARTARAPPRMAGRAVAWPGGAPGRTVELEHRTAELYPTASGGVRLWPIEQSRGAPWLGGAIHGGGFERPGSRARSWRW